jgi:putative redox protein
MSDDTLRSVRLERVGPGRFVVHNVRGGSMTIESTDGPAFTPVELLLAAIGGCTAMDVDAITGKRAEPATFEVTTAGHKVRDEAGANRMRDLAVEFHVTFPEGAGGDAAREVLPRAVRMSHERLCTVSRTVELGTPISTVIAPA